MKTKRLTNSELKDFKRCRRKWWLKDVRGLLPKQEDPAGTPIALGNRVHKALEAHGQGDPAGAEDRMWHEFNSGLEDDYAGFPEHYDAIKKDESLARAMLEGYLEWLEDTGANEDFEYAYPEETIEAPFMEIEGVEVTLLGKLDLRVRLVSTGELMFLDYKTVQDFSRIGLLHLNEQPLHYQLIARLTADEDERVSGGYFDMLRKVKRTGRAKPPFYERAPIRHNDAELESYWHRLRGEAADLIRAEKALEDGEDHRVVAYPNPTRDCSWDCPFLKVCPMFDDTTTDVEFVISEEYRVADYLSRYSGTHDQEEGKE